MNLIILSADPLKCGDSASMKVQLTSLPKQYSLTILAAFSKYLALSELITLGTLTVVKNLINAC